MIHRNWDFLFNFQNHTLSSDIEIILYEHSIKYNLKETYFRILFIFYYLLDNDTLYNNNIPSLNITFSIYPRFMKYLLT